MADPFSGLSPTFAENLQRLMADAPGRLSIASGYRSPERQATLWQNALEKYGSPEAARKWVAPPGHSMHNRGEAVDLGYGGGGLGSGNPDLINWVHQNAGNYGLTFPLSNENWHIEPLGARARQAPAMAAAQVGPSLSGDMSAALPAPPPQSGMQHSWMDFMPKAPEQAATGPTDPWIRMMQGHNPLGDNPLRSLVFSSLSKLFV